MSPSEYRECPLDLPHGVDPDFVVVPRLGRDELIVRIEAHWEGQLRRWELVAKGVREFHWRDRNSKRAEDCGVLNGVRVREVDTADSVELLVNVDRGPAVWCRRRSWYLSDGSTFG